MLGRFWLFYKGKSLLLLMSGARFKMRYAISYADAFAAATAEGLDAVVVTGDPEFEQLAKIRIKKLECGKKTWLSDQIIRGIFNGLGVQTLGALTCDF